MSALRIAAHLRFLPRVALLASCVALVAATASGQEKVKFPVGVGTKTLGTSAIFLATKKGFFDDFGLDVQPVLLRGTPITVQALLGESLYVALGSADSTIGAAATGVDLLSIGGVVNGLTQVIVAGKKYKTYGELRGTTIGVQALTSGATNVLKRILKKNGLDYPADYKLLAVGGGSFNLAALTSGQIAATYLVVPLSYSAEEQGFNVLGYYKDYFPNYQLSVLAVKRGWSEKNRGLWCDFSRALSVPIAGSMRTKRRPSIFLPRRFHLVPSLRARDGNTTRRMDLAFQRRDKPRRTQVYHGDLCRADEKLSARSAEVHRHQFPAAGDQRTPLDVGFAIGFGCQAPARLKVTSSDRG